MSSKGPSMFRINEQFNKVVVLILSSLRHSCQFKILSGLRNNKQWIYIIFVIGNAAYEVIFTNCLCQDPNGQSTSEWGLLTQTTSEYKPIKSTVYDVSCLSHISQEFSLLYYYMRNFCNLIGLEQWYFSLIWNTYMWKLQTFYG